MKLSRNELKWLRAASEKFAMKAKVANQETSDFAEWVINKLEPLDIHTVRNFLEQKLHIETKPYEPKEAGPRFVPGDLVSIEKDKHKDPETLGPYALWNGKIGVVESTDGLDALVSFKGMSAPVRFPNALKRMGVGIYSYTPPFSPKGSAAIEVIAFADPSAKKTDEQKMVVDFYLSKGKKETRSPNYYSGFVGSAKMSKEGGWYFTMFPQQRMATDPDSEKGYRPTTLNPAKTQILYIGLLGKRPTGWKEEWKEMKSSAEGSDKKAKEKYPWDECIADQMKQYKNKETAEKVCGKIKAESQGLGKSKKS